MDVGSPLKPDSKLKHRPLTPLRILRGVLCLVVFLSTAVTFLVCFAPVVSVAIRLLSIHYSRKTSALLFGIWLALWPFLFEKINGTKVVFSGDTVPPKERTLLIANHKTQVDWMYLWDLALRKGSLGHIKYVLKSSLMKLPVFGWGFHVLEFIPLKRKWEVDEPVVRKMLSSFADPADPLWMAIFPEGTDFEYYLLLPVFVFFLVNPSACIFRLLTLVRRIPIEKIPESNADAASWLTETFQPKDHLLSGFNTQGHFPDEGGGEELSTWNFLANFVLVIVLTIVLIYLAIFSTVWFKIYIGLSCAHLATATYFEIKPMPMLDTVKATFVCNGTRSE